MSVLIILRGNSGSGKSSAAKALQRKIGRNTLIIPQDTIRREMLWVRDGKDTAALPLLIDLLKYGNTHCEYVILEGILYAEWYKPLFEAAVEIFENRIFAYYYDIPFEETLRRHETKEKRFEFGEAEMRRWWKEKDYIGIIPEKILKEDISLECAVDIILRDVL
ncbi:uridine kinase [Clostridium sp. MCC353]|uniref:kinase n=1 Tax=Clostridium sp. MCC353 TaxID=2592646 RepID=UPI001C032BDA|nr:kinase [Clostridium sp. MCC353]MBT9777088.1 uridine kinase [Clostridium sp. MCC353]